jgi:hypothetical protein
VAFMVARQAAQVVLEVVAKAEPDHMMELQD